MKCFVESHTVFPCYNAHTLRIEALVQYQLAMSQEIEKRFKIFWTAVDEKCARIISSTEPVYGEKRESCCDNLHETLLKSRAYIVCNNNTDNV